MKRLNLLGNTVSDLENLMLSFGEKRYQGRRLFKWLYQSLQHDFSRMTDLSQELREVLAERYTFAGLEPVNSARSVDGTEKFLFRLSDEAVIESVLIPDGEKRTACISSQAGCALACSFCSTGQMGFKRNLIPGEIIGQLLFLRERYGRGAFHNIVFMGMGEPLLNYDNMVKAIEIISSEIGLSVSARKITVSTVGIVPGIYQLADSGLKVNLAVSLHAATDEKRRKTMPIANKFGVRELAEAAGYFAGKRKKRVTFEYLLIGGYNDSRQDAIDLSRVIQGIPCKINVILYNPVTGLPYWRPIRDEVDYFTGILYPRAPAVTIRKSRGLDIAAACGQLAGKYIQN
ncbi:MAG: 23S rRNA (adenine(2503)-C(2))-methyltransferase RlmN [Candidatus Zixiibacteriota bacterium]|nr:MAG: 23S rRNA (adenine(2503)-C(2))-methyltransferase RlmN [candidate division Zixibacteria bacterium]